MEILCAFDGEITESLWRFHGENPRLKCGETVEHLWKNRYGETVENQHTGKLQTRKNQRRATMG